MNPEPTSRQEAPSSVLGTLGWVGAVVLCALVAILILSWLGPASGP